MSVLDPADIPHDSDAQSDADAESPSTGANGRIAASFVDDDLGDPNCKQCLTPLHVGGTLEHPFWVCPTCGTTILD